MKKVILFFILFLIPLKANAYYCDYNDYNEVQKKAQNVNIMTDYKIEGDIAIFTITIYNLSGNQYVVDKINDKTYNYNGSDIVINVIKPGIYSFLVYSTDNYCDENNLNTLFAEIPTYNKFYKDELCKGIEGFKYCQRWFSASITYEDFSKSVTDYRNSLIKEEGKEEENYKSVFLYLFEFYIVYWYIILPVIIVVCLILIFIKRKQENKFNL